MSTTCRDCGNILGPGTRGCQRCALNLEAEQMISRVFWRFVVPIIVLGVVGIVVLVYLVR